MGSLRFSAVCVVLGACGGAIPVADHCRGDGECPLHQLCDDGACVTGCLADIYCREGLVCGPHGRCDAIAPNDLAAFDATAPEGLPDLAEPVDLGTAEAGLPTCGDHHLDPGEGCDDDNSDDPAAAATCTTPCRRRAACGPLAGSSGARIDPDSGRCYVAWPGPVSWAVAQRACVGNGGALVSIGSLAEDALVRALAGATPKWIGLFAPLAGAATRWVSGEPVVYRGWAAGEPDRAGGVEACVQLDPARGWDDAACGAPSSGLLPASPSAPAGFVCESACGNGLVEAGEECDPPGAGCTPNCHAVRPCDEPGAASSRLNGHCYFSAGPASDFTGALTACPTGTHLATLDGPEETEAALQAVSADAWFALRATGAPDVFVWERAGEDFNPRRYHAFATGEPNNNGVPDCVRLTADGWKDQPCTASYVHLCERE